MKFSIHLVLLNLLALLTFTACKTERAPAPLTPASYEPAKPEPARSQPIKPQVAKPEPAKPEPVVPVVPFVGPATPPDLRGAPLKISSLFGDNMVLQQGMSVPVWGWGEDGQTVTVSYGKQKASATVRQGKWMAKLRGLKPGAPDTLTIKGSRTIEFTNVVVGEVWLAGGQSNMEWPLKKTFEPEGEILAATNSNIRFYVVPNVKADEPQSDVAGKWQVSTPDTAAGFSAVAYYFAKDLHAARNVPIGIVQSDWGATPAEAWTRHEVLEADPRLRAEILDAYPIAEKNYQEALANYERDKAEAAKKKLEFKRWAPWKPSKPGELYNGMIAPLIPFAIKGAIWYQGESNAARAHQYRSLFPDLISNWRRDWAQGDFPFICVQLAPFKAIQSQPVDSEWAELREAQLMATKALPNVGIAVITDVGDEKDIHPMKKAPVGERLALAARAMAYGEKIVYSGPIYKNLKIRGDKAVVSFDHVGSGLECRGGALKGFAVCGDDRKFYWAIAEFEGDNSVAVWSPNVENPVAVRYGWADYPVVNLWNKEGFPASPFRTDDFPMITAPKDLKVSAR